MFTEKLDDFDPNDYGLCTTKKFNEKLSEVHKSLLDKLSKFRKKQDEFEADIGVYKKYKKQYVQLDDAFKNQLKII